MATRDLAAALAGGDPARPFYLGEVIGLSFDGQPPMLLIDDTERPMRFVGSPADYTYYDTVVWVNYNGAPLVIGKLPHMAGDVESYHLVGGAGEPAFQNSWANFGGAHATAGFYIQPDGWVRLKGLVASGTDNTTIFTLPSGYRPPVNIPFTSISNGTVCTIEVDPTGTVGKTSGGSNAHVSLAGITFPTQWNRAAWEVPELDTTWSRGGITSPTAELFTRDDGWCWLKGAGTGTSGNRIMTLPVDARTILDHIMVGDDIASIGYARMNLSYKGVIAHGGAPSATTANFGGLNWFARRGARTFTSPTFLNSWTNLGTTFEAAGYYIDHFGVVHLQGNITGSNTSPIFNLPAGFRPSEQHIFFTIAQGEAVARIDVLANGDVQKPIPSPGSGYLALNGVSFRAEQ
jgi:hypothetical protein